MVPKVPRVAIIGVVLAACAAPSSTATTALQTASASFGTAAASASPGATSSLAPGAIGRYESELGFTLDLPVGWRKAACGSGISQRDPILAGESFTAVAEADETLTDTGAPDPRVLVRVEDARGRTPLAWLQSGLFANGPGVRFEEVSADGRRGARVAVVATGETVGWAVLAHGWLYGIGHTGPIPTGRTAQEAASILASLHVLDTAGIDDPSRPTASPRSPQSVADALANGLVRQDITLLANVMAPCMSSFLERAGGTGSSRLRYAEQLRRAFVAGLTITVPSSQIDGSPDSPFLQTIWSQPGQPDRVVELLIRRDGDRWSWAAALTLQNF
jgi:hypothetical protein